MAGDAPIAGREELVEGSAHLERAYLGLRTRRGLDASAVPADLASRWNREGLVTISKSRIVPTVRGWLVLDRLVADLTEVADGAARADDGQAPPGVRRHARKR